MNFRIFRTSLRGTENRRGYGKSFPSGVRRLVAALGVLEGSAACPLSFPRVRGGHPDPADLCLVRNIGTTPGGSPRRSFRKYDPSPIFTALRAEFRNFHATRFRLSGTPCALPSSPLGPQSSATGSAKLRIVFYCTHFWCRCQAPSCEFRPLVRHRLGWVGAGRCSCSVSKPPARGRWGSVLGGARAAVAVQSASRRHGAGGDALSADPHRPRAGGGMTDWATRARHLLFSTPPPAPCRWSRTTEPATPAAGESHPGRNCRTCPHSS